MKFDRMFNKVEKFEARAMTDPFNHERREKRMLERKAERWQKNYTYFFGGLTEEEQMYRDYFESELELDPEDEFIDERLDEYHLAQQGSFNPALYDF
jgi:isopenicillin N synthase-like dioxygenase